MRTIAVVLLFAGVMVGVAPQFGCSAAAKGDAKMPACCGDKCATMPNCCTTDANGKTTCSMGGSCCVKVDKK